MFFDIFKLLCEKKGVSPKKATEDIGLSNSITTKWKKTGATPKGDTLQRIADYFGVTTDYLLTGEDTKKSARPYREGQTRCSKARGKHYERYGAGRRFKF